jgi:predicted ThiF/HesA family dinucleotide-utilizing enzyme
MGSLLRCINSGVIGVGEESVRVTNVDAADGGATHGDLEKWSSLVRHPRFAHQ